MKTNLPARLAALSLCSVLCLALACGFTRAYFVTARASGDNALSVATYAVRVADQYGVALVPDASGRVQYVCPLTAGDEHAFTLSAQGTAYSGHCTVLVENDQLRQGYTLRLDPDESGAIYLRAAAGSVLTFSFAWGEGEDVLQPDQSASAYGLGAIFGDSYRIAHSETPHHLYRAAPGASLAGIANYYGVSLTDLRAYNAVDAYADRDALPADTELQIPFAAAPPPAGPYVPSGALALSLSVSGDAALPASACLNVSGADGWLQTVPCGDLLSGTSYLTGLPVGEYTLALIGAEQPGCELSLLGDVTLTVTEDAAAEAALTLRYTRSAFDLALTLDVSGAVLPASACLSLSRADGYSAIFPCTGAISVPAGIYTVALVGADLPGYQLSCDPVAAEVTALGGSALLRAVYTPLVAEGEA